MACVILPSETARLVYGYLVKENLNEIAMQFLESSPYLTDCCQIVKSGFQFNTKLMGKDLQELLQEYSVIHNLVNNKVSLLCKTSLLYKRIKLRCESLPEIIELILFWKYKNSKSEENSEKTDKNSSNPVVGNSSEYLNTSSDVTSVKMSNVSTLESGCYNDNNDRNSIPNNESTVPENFHSKLCCETYKEVESGRNSFQVRQSEPNVFDSEMNKERTSMFTPMHVSMDTSDVGNDNGNSGSPGKIDANTNVITINSKSQSENVLVNEISIDTLETHEEDCFESQIKIVGIEENNHDENHTLGVYSKSLGEGDENLNLENSSVVFVGQEVGNVTIDQERNQIIVIPIDYYKAQGELQSRMDMDNEEKHDSVQETNVGGPQKDEIIFEGVTTITSTANQLYNEKPPTVDDNIVTEKDFLKNRHLMYNIEKELKKAETKPPPPQPLQETNENVALHPVPAPLIVVSQTILPNKPARYRTILPKKEEYVQVHPVVVVQPLLENNKDLTKTNPSGFDHKPKMEVHRKGKKKILSKPKVKETDNSGSLNMPTIKPPKGNNKTNSEESQPQTVSPEETTKKTDSEKTNEEKENLDKSESKKTETPVFVTKRNSKRLSLSTPRRRSHIRALEFETPPKTSAERKKSRTSPKAKVGHANVERKSVRNTLFKSPIPEDVFKSPVVSKMNKKVAAQPKSEEIMEPLNELSIPIATRSPNTKLSEAWENLTGVGCVIGEVNTPKTSPTKKMWDADLRCFIPENSQEVELEKKRIRKPEKNVKDTRKTVKKKVVSTKKTKPAPVTVSPSKMSLTAKRNTYSINGNEEGSPIRSLLDDLKIVTPFKDIETIRPAEETPLTKLLRENINTIDIDLSMINTPSFPPTPSIVITPDLDDMSMTGANYYSPTKDCSKDKLLKITDYFRVETEKTNKKDTKEMHEKVIDDLVTKAKEIIGIGKEDQEESNALKSRPSGKILSMVKIQMLTQCNKKLCENIPINEENNFANQTTLIGRLSEEAGAGKHDLKEELEEKRKRALKKIKVVKENLSQAKGGKVAGRGRKRRSGNGSKSKSDTSAGEKLTSESDESLRKESGIFHSTPYAEKKLREKAESNNKVDSKILDDIRQEFPSFQNNTDRYPELTEKSRKKFHYVEHFLKLTEIVKFVRDFDENNPPRLFLKSSLRRFFQVFYKWLKHPHRRELNASPETKTVLREYLSVFDKINRGLNQRCRKVRQDEDVPDTAATTFGSDAPRNNSGNKAPLSDDEEREWKKKESEKRKDEETEDGVVSTLPLKKRKSTVQQVEIKNSTVAEKEETKNCAENVSQTQNFLQDIDVDRFLSQIHGHENR